jgi:hypothetical protein
MVGCVDFCSTKVLSLCTPTSSRARTTMNDQLYYLTSPKKKTNHILHLLLCIPTCGLWLFIWGITTRSNDWHNRKIDKQIKQILQRRR